MVAYLWAGLLKQYTSDASFDVPLLVTVLVTDA